MILRSLPLLFISSSIFAGAVWLLSSGAGARTTFVDASARSTAVATLR